MTTTAGAPAAAVPPRTISPQLAEQMHVSAYLRFETRVLEHLRTHHSADVAQYSDEALRLDVRDAVQVADGYGLRTEYPAVLMVLLMFLLGRDFDLRPEYTDVAALLRDTEREPVARAEAAYERALMIAEQET